MVQKIKVPVTGFLHLQGDDGASIHTWFNIWKCSFSFFIQRTL